MLDLRTMASIKAALLFLIIGSPLMYKLTQQLLGGLFTISSKGCPTMGGLVLHAVVLGLITYVLMGFCLESFEDMDSESSEQFEDEMPVEGYQNVRVYKR
jgi:hypothetical protein